VATLILSPMGAIAQTNLRRMIGFILIGGIGSVLAGLALASEQGIGGATIYAFNSILVISALYLVAGLIERVTGETDTRAMGGLYAANSGLSIAFLVLVFAVSGMPPFLGFWPKLMLMEAALSAGGVSLTVAIILNAVLTAIAGTRAWAHIFWRAGREGEGSEQPNDRLRPMSGPEFRWGLLPAAVLTALIFWFGVQPNLVIVGGRTAAVDMLDPARYVASTGLEVKE